MYGGASLTPTRTSPMRALFLSLTLAVALPARAQHVHTADTTRDSATALPASPGQSAFGAISEIVAMLSADSTTDWSKVDIEALRQHLIDMDQVILRSRVQATEVPGGVSLLIQGDGSVAASIVRMVGAHSAELDRLPRYRAQTAPAADGIVLVVTSRNSSDARTVARIRALGLAGLLAEGSHHPAHHLAIARGGAPHTGH